MLIIKLVGKINKKLSQSAQVFKQQKSFKIKFIVKIKLEYFIGN